MYILQRIKHMNKTIQINRTKTQMSKMFKCCKPKCRDTATISMPGRFKCVSIILRIVETIVSWKKVWKAKEKRNGKRKEHENFLLNHGS